MPAPRLIPFLSIPRLSLALILLAHPTTQLCAQTPAEAARQYTTCPRITKN